MRLRHLGLLTALLAPACGQEAAEPGWQHTFATLSVGPGEEIESACQSWSLGNEEPLFVSGVVAENEGGLHHSNWYYFTEDLFDGPDGTWDCFSRGFDPQGATLLGGILFGQSTQALGETQAFAPGAAIRLPPHTRIVGNLHVLNATASPLSTSVSLSLQTLPVESVESELQPMGVLYQALDIAPHARSTFTTECDFAGIHERKLDRAPDFDVFYGLAHYHALGVGARAELVGGERDGELLFETSSVAGEPMGAMLGPVNVAGATGVRMSCSYDNPRDDAVGWGFGDQEMCGLGFYTNSTLRLAGLIDESTSLGADGDGVLQSTGPCTFLDVPLL